MVTTGALNVLLALALPPAAQIGGGLPTSGGPVVAPPDLTSRFEVPPGVSVKLWAASGRS